MFNRFGVKKRLVLLISVLLFSGHTLSTDFIPGELAVSGELVASGCDIDPSTRNLWIEFGQISARDIDLDQAVRITRPFLIRLIGCQFFSSKDSPSPNIFVTVTFNGNISAQDPSVLIPSGEGKGFGIQIRDGNGEPLIFDRPSLGDLLHNGSNTLRFTASLVPTENYITAGEFYAMARVVLNYN